MSAGLVSAKVDVSNPTVNVTGARNSARSSIEVKDSCNCCKACFPCFGRKAKKTIPDTRIANLRDDAIIRPVPIPTYDISIPRQEIVRKSPSHDNISQFVTMPATEKVTVTVVCDRSQGTTPQASSPISADSSDFTEKSV